MPTFRKTQLLNLYNYLENEKWQRKTYLRKWPSNNLVSVQKYGQIFPTKNDVNTHNLILHNLTLSLLHVVEKCLISQATPLLENFSSTFTARSSPSCSSCLGCCGLWEAARPVAVDPLGGRPLLNGSWNKERGKIVTGLSNLHTRRHSSLYLTKNGI